MSRFQSVLLNYFIAFSLLPVAQPAVANTQAISDSFTLDTAVLRLDTDSDGMPDWWEQEMMLDPHLYNAEGNPDNDSLTNIEEFNSGTDPLTKDWEGPDSFASSNFTLTTGITTTNFILDTDEDGMPDWWEMKYNLALNKDDSQNDPDLDSATNLDEYFAGTNPIVSDFAFFYGYKSDLFFLDTSNPFIDSDKDGIPDWWEKQYLGNGLVMSSGGDLDMDGQSNLKEYRSGHNPLDPNSLFHVESILFQKDNSSNQVALTWMSLKGHRYSIFKTDDLRGNWSSIPTDEILGTDSPITFFVPVDMEGATFIRVQASVESQ